MKNSLLLFSVLFILCFELAEAQPSFPDSSHVLVVYNSLDQTSIEVKNYYQQRRGIPESNIVPLDDLQDSILINYGGEDHLIVLDQQGEIIKDWNNQYSWCPTKHAWIYFNERIAIPIANYLRDTYVNGIQLKDIIRFIVLCKGLPYRINSKTDDGGSSLNHNVTVDRLLCFLGETIEDPDALLDYYYTSPPPNCDFDGYAIENPYYNVDPNFSMEYFFIPNYYSKYNGYFGRNITLSYLVSHLDAPSLDIVKNMIDSSLAAINSSNYDWFIDSDPSPCHGSSVILKPNETKNVFDLLGITNYFIENTNSVYTTHNKPIISYCSNGRHTSLNPEDNCDLYFQPDYLQSQLNLTYIAGSVFNTAESFNASTIGTWPIVRRPGAPQGTIPEFMLTSGTVGVGQAYHGTQGGKIINNAIILPSYAMGYSFIEAAYLGIEFLTDERVVVGDPLTRITYPCERTIISSNTTIESGDYDCDIIVLEGVTLKVNSESIINFRRNTSLKVYGELEIENYAVLNFYGYSELVLVGGSGINFGSGTQLVFNERTRFAVDDDFEITLSYNFVFNDESEFQVNGLNMGENSSLTFNNISHLIVNELLSLNPGATLNFNDDSYVNVNGSFTILGEFSNKVTINFANSIYSQFNVNNGLSLIIDNAIFNNGGINYSNTGNQNLEIHLSITNTTFNNVLKKSAISLSLKGANVYPIPLISNCTFNSCSTTAIRLAQMPEIIISHNTIDLMPNSQGIYLVNNGRVEISDCIFTGGKKGIVTYRISPEEVTIIENLLCNLVIEQCTFEPFTSVIIPVTSTAIEIVGNDFFNSVIINGNHFYNPDIGISVNNFLRFRSAPIITNNVLSGKLGGAILSPSPLGIQLSNGNEILISNNSITNFLTGISLNIVNTPYIKENTISAIDLTVDPLSGIMAVSSHGQIRKNTIQHHKYGIELGSSSPKIGANIITDNDNYGIYISNNSHPVLSEAFIGGEGYPLSGYNTIRENGSCNLYSYSEIYLTNRSSVSLEKGCNTVADDREEPLHCGYLYLIDGKGVRGKINAIRNYWGEANGSNPEGRFGQSLTVLYDDWLTEPCTYSESGTELILATSKGVVYDTVYSTGNIASGLSDIESRFATANAYYYNNQYTQAKQEYEEIIENYGDSTESLQAYSQLYALAKLTNGTPPVFNQLKDFYLQKAGNQSDSMMIGTLTHLSDLCLVSAEEYITAINKFDEIAQQNPNTDIALYRQIDALTTSLLMPQDSSLNKGVLGKYSVNNLSEYTNKLSELLRTRGKGGIESEKELLPTEYTLYQNYPNPFNPITTIKYDLPSTSDISLIIYDILGRKIKELVNQKQQAGKYEVQFDASNLASGVYIYQLSATGGAEKYMSSRKMILLR